MESPRDSDAQAARDRAIRQGLLDAIADLIFYKDLDGRYLGCNAAFLRYADVSREQLLGRTGTSICSRRRTPPGTARSTSG